MKTLHQELHIQGVAVTWEELGEAVSEDVKGLVRTYTTKMIFWEAERGNVPQIAWQEVYHDLDESLQTPGPKRKA